MYMYSEHMSSVLATRVWRLLQAFCCGLYASVVYAAGKEACLFWAGVCDRALFRSPVRLLYIFYVYTRDEGRFIVGVWLW